MAESKRMGKTVSKKRKFIRSGILYAELNDFLATELAENGYTGCEVRVTPSRTEVVIRSIKPHEVTGPGGRRRRALTALVQKRFKFQEGKVQCLVDEGRDKSLSALAQAEAVRYRLLEGMSVRKACYAVLKFVIDQQAQGCEVVVSGKLRGQRAKSMKFREGFMIHAGDATNYYITKAVKHVQLPQGVLGIKVKIMLPWAGDARGGVKQALPDKVTINDPRKDEAFNEISRKIQAQQEAVLREAEMQQRGMELAAAGGGMEMDDDGQGAGGPPPVNEFEDAPMQQDVRLQGGGGGGGAGPVGGAGGGGGDFQGGPPQGGYGGGGPDVMGQPFGGGGGGGGGPVQPSQQGGFQGGPVQHDPYGQPPQGGPASGGPSGGFGGPPSQQQPYGGPSGGPGRPFGGFR